MAVTTVQVSGTTTPDNWVLAAGASKVAAVSAPDDDTTSYIRSTSTEQTYQYFTCSPSLNTGDTITQIVLRARARRGGANNAQFRIGYTFTPQGGGTQTSESGVSELIATASYADYTHTHSSLSVLWGSGLQIWIRNAQPREVELTTFEIEITYTPVDTGDGQPAAARARLIPGMRRPHGHQGW